MRNIKAFLLKILGDVKVFRFPCWIVYDPDTFGMTGTMIRDVLNLIRPGDVILRGYRHYLDGYFIPGEYSHSGIYIGDNMIVHAVAEGVSKIDILEFLMCDVCCVMRPISKDAANHAVDKVQSYIGTEYDFDFSKGDKALYCHELTAISFYPLVSVERYIPKVLGGLIKGKYKVFLAQSFTDSPNFEMVYKSHLGKKKI